MKNQLFFLLGIAIITGFTSVELNSQTININSGTPYTQDFSSLTSGAWNNGTSPLAGWSLFNGVSGGTPITSYGINDGSSNTGGFYNYGTTGDPDRALGGLGSGNAIFGSPGTGAIAGWFAVAFTNTSGATINQVTISFDGEQWRCGNNTTAQTMVLEYGIGPTFQTASWTAPGGTFNWTSIVNTTTAAAVNGNTTGLVAGIGGNLNSINWTDGSILWIRWAEINDAGNDHALAIDNFSFTATVAPVCSTPTLSTIATDISCFGDSNGAIDLIASGGSVPYTDFAWTGPSSFSSSSEDLADLLPGTYTVTVTATGGCTTSTTATVNEPSAVSANIISAANVTCNGGNNGSATVNASGGVGSYVYSWAPSGGTGATASSLVADIYTVTVIDGNGCSISTSTTITEPSAIAISSTDTAVTCNGGNDGSIDLTTTGGTGTHSYLWSNSATTEDIVGLVAGVYTVTVTDDNLCTASTSITITEPNAIVLSETHVDAICGGAASGSIDLSSSGGTGSHTYLWSNSAITEDIGGLTGGTYSVTVTDAAGCTSTTSVVIAQPLSINLSTSVTNVFCNGDSTGTINLTASGGTGSYTFDWSNTATTEDISSLAAGSYTVTVTDINGCTISTSATVTEAPVLTATTTNVQPGCASSLNGFVDLTVSGGTPGYTYSWSNSATTQDISGLANGTYTVTVTDTNGCITTASAVLNSSANLQLDLIWTNASCNGEDDGTMDLTVLTGSSPFTYAWSNGATTQDISGLSAGNYTVTVTDAAGCTGSTGEQIGEPGLISTNISITVCGSYTSPSGLYLWTTTGLYSDTLTSVTGCDSLIGIDLTIPTPNTIVVASGLTLTATATGVTYQWLDCDNGMNPVIGATSQIFHSPAPGHYAVIVTQDECLDTSDCYATIDVSSIPVNLEASITLYPNPNNGSFNVSISGLSSADLYIEIMDITGKTLYHQLMNDVQTDIHIPFNLDNFENGIYFMRVFSGGKYKILKWVKN